MRKTIVLMLLLCPSCREGLRDGISGDGPIAVDVLCDSSKGSPCSDQNLASVIQAAIGESAHTPGSTVRLWNLGNTLGETRLVSQVVTPVPRKRSSKARRAEQEIFKKESVGLFQIPPSQRTRSPILNSIAKITFTKAAQPRFLVVVSDGREYSDLGDFECGAIPDPPEAFSWSLEGARVFFAFASLDEIPGGRCQLDLERVMRIRKFWKEALTRAGASYVEFRTGTVNAEDFKR